MRQRRAPAGREQMKAVAEASGNAVDAEGRDAARGELDREWDPVKPAANGGHRACASAIGDIPGSRCVRSYVEEPDRAVPRHILRIEVVFSRDVQPRHTINVLLDDAQRLAAGGEDPHARAPDDEGLGHRGGCLDHMLAVVENDQGVFRPQRCRHAIGGDRTRAERDIDGNRDGARHQRGIGEWTEIDQPRAVGKAR